MARIFEQLIMMMEADPRVGFFSILEVMTGAKETYRTAVMYEVQVSPIGCRNGTKRMKGGEKQGKYILLLSPRNRRKEMYGWTN